MNAHASEHTQPRDGQPTPHEVAQKLESLHTLADATLQIASDAEKHMIVDLLYELTHLAQRYDPDCKV